MRLISWTLQSGSEQQLFPRCRDAIIIVCKIFMNWAYMQKPLIWQIIFTNFYIIISSLFRELFLLRPERVKQIPHSLYVGWRKKCQFQNDNFFYLLFSLPIELLPKSNAPLGKPIADSLVAKSLISDPALNTLLAVSSVFLSWNIWKKYCVLIDSLGPLYTKSQPRAITHGAMY